MTPNSTRSVDGGSSRTLGDYFTLQRGTTYASKLLGRPGPVLLGLATIQRNGGFRSDSLRTYGGGTPAQLLVQPGQLYLSLKDVTQSADLLGAVARLPPNHPSGRLTQDTVRLDPKHDDVPLDYIYWLLRTPQYREYCRAHATGTTNLGLAREDFLAFPVPSPSREQLVIVDLLGQLESKIELNRQMSRTLEEMAQAIFRSWFIDFDGHTDLVPSELGPIPRGWSVAPIGNVVEVVGGNTPRTEEPAFWEGGTHCWTSPKDLSGNECPVLLDTSKRITDAGLAEVSSGLLPAGTFLLSSRAPIGYTAISAMPVAVNQGYVAIPPSGNLSAIFLLFWTRANMDAIKSRASGTTFPEISKRNFRSIPIAVPSKELRARFDAATRPLFDRLVAAMRESRTLTSLRDLLLPKLLSGELRIPDAEKLVGEVT